MKSRRLLQLDALKALAAYGPVAEAVQAQWPALIDWLYEHARIAVQVFLVLGRYSEHSRERRRVLATERGLRVFGHEHAIRQVVPRHRFE